MRPGPLLHLSDIRVQFGREPVLEHVDLSVDNGQVVTVIGPNGAGKTTLLRVALGLQAPLSGSVRRRPEIRIGYMPQRLAIDETLPLTVGRFLALAGAPARRRADVLREAGISDNLLRHPIQRVSGGEFQRVLLARALLREPDLLVLDEPAQSLDLAGQSELYSLIARVKDRYGCGVLLVSHDLHLVMAAADHVVCLNRHVCCTGHPREVRRNPAYLALFPGGIPVEGVAVYEHAHDHAHTAAGEVVPLVGDLKTEDLVAAGGAAAGGAAAERDSA